MPAKRFVVAFAVYAACLAVPPRAAAIEKPQRFLSHDQAGSTHVSILTVAPWDEYVDSLQPVFEMTPQKALGLALPTTSTEEEKILRAFGLALNIAGKSDTSTLTQTATSATTATSSLGSSSGTTTTGTTTTPTSSSSASSGNTATDSTGTTSTTTQASGDLAKVPTQSFTQTTPGLEINPPDSADKDPVLQYQAATSIFQEIKLLSRYLKDMAGRQGYVPYVVRAQISVMPRAHHSPYDTYTTISFFAGSSFVEAKEDEVLLRVSSRLTDAATAFGLKGDERVQDALAGYAKDRGDALWRVNSQLPSPLVLPILVTDNLEGRLHSRTTEDLKEFLLAAVALQSTAASAKLALKSDKIRSLLATDLNSLLTVARINDNSLRVRFGAASDTVSSHAMVAQTHNVTFLLLVKKEQVNNKDCLDAPIHFQARTSFVDADTGLELPLPDYSKKMAVARALFRRFGQHYGIKFNNVFKGKAKADFVEVLYAADFNDRATFDAKVNSLVKDWGDLSNYAKSAIIDTFWVEAVNNQAQLQWHSGQFEVPQMRFPNLPYQSAILFDDQKAKSARVSLVGGHRLRRDEIEARLKFKAGSKIVTLRPVSTVVSDGLDRVDLSFQSPSLWNPSPPAPFAPTDLTLTVLKLSDETPICRGVKLHTPVVPLHYRSEAEAKPEPKAFQLEIRAGSGVIRATKRNEGPVTFQVARTDDGKPLEGDYFLEVAGGDVIPISVTAKPDGCLVHGEVYKLTGPCSISLRLSNIPNPLNPLVTITLKRKLEKVESSGTSRSWLAIAHGKGI